ncbi:breast carcinoma-amplified sequence 1 isoform X7 [Silurus asotus]|uniref:Breast carcinoma-amplified sequence 1 isoform X7 n=1 Tax=Silurus asotus TaxID=30991 RepID=A0AAD5A403_SILAS|nr:breast carcinoma-amplified sequence 1 isoform X7 [Silurus asotus]
MALSGRHSSADTAGTSEVQHRLTSLSTKKRARAVILAPPTSASIETNGTQAKAPSVTVDAPGLQISALTASTEKEVPTESSTPAKDTSKQAGTSSKFNMMFKKKPGAADVADEVKIVPAVLTESQKSIPTQVSVGTNGIQAKAPSVTVDPISIQISASTASAEKEVPTESSTPAKDTSKQAGTPSKFNMMFKKKPVAADVADETPTQVSVATNGIQAQAPSVTVDATGIQISASTASAEKEFPTESSTPAKDTSKQAGTPSKFNMMFKKKPVAADVATEVKIVPAVLTESQKSEPTDIKASPQADKEPQNEALVLSTTEVTQDSTQSEQTGAEEKSVMNFFKTFHRGTKCNIPLVFSQLPKHSSLHLKVTSTKTTKEATPSPDVSKEQVQEASKVPPPPPPAPPKMESKAEPAVKKEQAPAVEVAAAAAKEPEAQSKAKTKDSPFSKIFRSKSEVKEEAKPVEIQVDASKASTLEVSAKPEHPPAPKPEEKKAEKKPSPFANLLKPKATESKKQTPAAPTAPADAAPSTKAKEEPKQAAPAAPAATSADNKSGQKRHSDAGVQTEPVAPEKAK